MRINLSKADGGTMTGPGDVYAKEISGAGNAFAYSCLLYTSPSPRDRTRSRMPSSA